MAEPRVYSWSYEDGDVTETVERLTVALADRYTIQEELGTGGMEECPRAVRAHGLELPGGLAAQPVPPMPHLETLQRRLP